MRITYTDRDYDKARSLIDKEDSICYDIALNHGQIFHNVKHMTWFIKAVSDWIGY